MRQSWARSLDRSCLLFGTLILAARQYDLPSTTFWLRSLDNREYVVVALIAWIGVFGALTPVEWLASRGMVERRAAIRHQVLTHFGRILVLARNASRPIDYADLGLHIWRVKRTWRYPLRPRLVRLATYRLGNTPATRSFLPRKGAGVVGLCWKQNAEAAMNVEALRHLMTSRDDYEKYRRENGIDAVMGLGWEEFRRIRHRGAVFASPVRNGRGKFVGCISLDAAEGFGVLDVNQMWQELNELCAVVSHDGFDHI